MDLNNIRDWLELVLVVAAVVTVVIKISKYVDKGFEHRIIDVIKQSTKQIEFDANGGQSLYDMHKKMTTFIEYQKKVNEEREAALDILLERQGDIKDDVASLREAVLEIEDELP